MIRLLSRKNILNLKFHILLRRKRSLNFNNSVYVLFSESLNVYENLALEHLIYEKVTFSYNNKLILFLWQNSSSVVIGRHQNPWKEVNLTMLKDLKVNLSRRMSGGGSVYHDLGNLNLTFFTSKEMYNRKENLNFIISTLFKKYGFDLKINEKDDIILDGNFKISGTAAKLGLHNAYHHCTLLCKSNLDNLSGLLQNPFGENITTNATQSMKSKTRNLFHTSFDLKELVDTFCSEFYNKYDTMKSETHSLRHINPSNIPGLHDEAEKLKSWDWLFAKTPKFVVSLDIKLLNSDEKVEIKLTVNKGVILDYCYEFDIQVDYHLDFILNSLKGTLYSYKEVYNKLNNLKLDKGKLFYYRQIINLLTTVM